MVIFPHTQKLSPGIYLNSLWKNVKETDIQMWFEKELVPVPECYQILLNQEMWLSKLTETVKCL